MVTDTQIGIALEAFDQKAGYSKIEKMRAALEAALSAAEPQQAPSVAVKALRLDTSKPEFDDFDRGWEACLDAISSLFSHPSCDKRIRSALAAQVQDVAGWQLVPKEPTHEMLKAMFEAMFEAVFDGTSAPMIGAGYDAALAAAPAKQGVCTNE